MSNVNKVNLAKGFGVISNWIGGKEVPATTKEFQDIFCPYNGESIGKVPMSTQEELALAVNNGKNAFLKWKNTHIKQRVQVMFKLKTLLERDFDELCHLICTESGKTLTEAAGDVAKAIEVLEFGCSIPNIISGQTQEVSTDILCRNTKEPLGVVACIAPFNFPIMVPMWTIPIALTVGNCMVLKPSEQVPLSALRLAKLLKEAGLPDGVFNVVNGGKEVVNAICDHPDIAAISFVGSTRIAKHVYARASANFKRVLCLGGAKNHLIVMPDADVETAPKQIIDSAIGCAGQRCMAASVMVAVGDCSKIIEQMKAYAQSVKLGEGMGAIINKASVERINGYITQAADMGASLLVDGRGKVPTTNGTKEGYWVGPTVIDNLNESIPAVKEEIFGPVMSIIHVKTLEEAMKLENSNPYGNACSIFTTQGKNADYVIRNANAGMCGVNVGVPVPREPFSFGGWFESKFGVGDITGVSGMNFWTQDKKVTVKWIEPEYRNWMS